MQYSMKYIQDELGEKYNPNSEYRLLTHQGATDRCCSDPNSHIVGQVPDSTLNETGTMIIVETRAPEPKNPLEAVSAAFDEVIHHKLEPLSTSEES